MDEKVGLLFTEFSSLLFLAFFVYLFDCNIQRNKKFAWLQPGMGLSRGKTHGRMGYWEPIAPSLQTQIIPTNFSPRIR